MKNNQVEKKADKDQQLHLVLLKRSNESIPVMRLVHAHRYIHVRSGWAILEFRDEIFTCKWLWKRCRLVVGKLRSAEWRAGEVEEEEEEDDEKEELETPQQTQTGEPETNPGKF